MIGRRNLFWGVVLALMLGWVGMMGVSAQTKSVDVLRRDGEITILANGDVQVVETWEVRFIGGPFHYAFREIPLNKVEDITGWSVAEGGQVYEPGDGEAGTYVLDRSSDKIRITWYFPTTSDATRIFILRYTLKGALWIHDNGDQFFWKFIEADRAYPIEQATVVVHLPAAFNAEQILTETYRNGQAMGGGQVRRGGEVVFQGGPFPGGTEWEIRVQWPHGVVQASPPAWQKWEMWKPWINLGLLALALVVALGGPALAYLWWYTKGRDPQVRLRVPVIPRPPADVPPGVVGVLVDEKADMQDILATLADLGNREYLRIEQALTKSGRVSRREGPRFVLLNPGWSGLRPFERRLLAALFAQRSNEVEALAQVREALSQGVGKKVAETLEAVGVDVEAELTREEETPPGWPANLRRVRSLASLRERFYKHIPDIQRDLYDEVVRLGYFDRAPDKVRQRTVALTALFSGLPLSAVACGLVRLGSQFWGAFALMIALMIAEAAFIVAAWFIPRKTLKGAQEAAKWQAFKRYLRNIRRYTQPEEAKEVFERYFPYAIAFGLEKEWVRQFEPLNVPPPRWYTPVPYGGYGYGGVPGRVGHGAMPTGAGRGAPSLDGMAQGAFTSLSQVSDGLMSALNQAATVFVSAPSSSGSGGGGFSGGGGGRGGGGGGSSGFG